MSNSRRNNTSTIPYKQGRNDALRKIVKLLCPPVNQAWLYQQLGYTKDNFSKLMKKKGSDE